MLSIVCIEEKPNLDHLRQIMAAIVTCVTPDILQHTLAEDHYRLDVCRYDGTVYQNILRCQKNDV